MATTFQLNKSYNFRTLAAALLNHEYKNQKVVGIMNAKEAVKYRDIQTLHSNVSKMVTNLPQDINKLTFLLFENMDREKQVLALEYIDPNSIVEITTFNIRIDIRNANTEDLSLLRYRLLELGYTNFDITTYE